MDDVRDYLMTSSAGTRTYYLHTPKGVRRTTKVPLVVALHGCDQSARQFADSTRLNALADRHGFAVAYPEQSRLVNGQRCWSWYRPEHQTRHRGEPAIIAGIVHRLVSERTRWRIDPGRVYVTGISAGGGMAMVLGATYPDVFAAVGTHSAPPYRSATGSARAFAAMQGQALAPPPPAAGDGALPPLIAFQGTMDRTVRRVNARRLAEQWIAWYDGPQLGPVRSRRTLPAKPFTRSGTRGYTVSHWSAGRRRLLEVWEVDGLGHAWCGGAPDSSYSDPRGPRASTAIWRFFARHSTNPVTLRTRAG